MKISIKNFKCWHEKCVEIKDEGIILLSGKSGKGKSSILDAIYFCLFGNGQKVISSGKNNCQVSIEIDNIIFDHLNVSKQDRVLVYKAVNELVLSRNQKANNVGV